MRDGQRLGFEFKRTDAPKLTPSMRSAQADIGLDKLFVIHAGRDTWPLADGIEAVSRTQVWGRLAAPALHKFST